MKERATLNEKLSVLDYLHGPPSHTQKETIAHFNNFSKLKLSQSTLSNWLTNEHELRKRAKDNPNWKNFKRKPTYKHNHDILIEQLKKKSNVTESDIITIYSELNNGCKIPKKLLNELLQSFNTSPNINQIYEDIGFNTRLIHSQDWLKSFNNELFDLSDIEQVLSPPAPPPPQPATSNIFTGNNTNSLQIEKILENITNGHVTLYNSGTSAIMGILTYINPANIYISNNGYKGTHNVIKLLNKLTKVKSIPLESSFQILPNSVIIIESPMNPIGYVQDISYFSNLIKLSNIKSCYLIVDSTLAPPPLQFPFQHGADFIVYSAVKYLSGVSDLSAGFIVSLKKNDKLNLIQERNALNTSIANFDSFLLLRSLRTYKMRILNQCDNTKNIIQYLLSNLYKYAKTVKSIHHSSLQINKHLIINQLNNYYNPVFAIEFTDKSHPGKILKKFNFLSNNPNMDGGETLVESLTDNPNFIYSNDLNYEYMLRFSVGCEDYQDIIRDIDQALLSI